MNRGTLTREAIIRTLAGVLRPLSYVHAFYEGGAAAFKRIDKWSDIDLYVVVDDEKHKDAFLVIENALRTLSPIKQKYEVTQSQWPGLFQAFYKVEKASEYLIIDLAILNLTCPEKLLEPKMHGNNVFYFNKANKTSAPVLDKKEFIKKLNERLTRLQARFEMFNIFVQKEINRGNSLEAFDLYNTVTLASLVEALRIKHNPIHYDFKTRYVHYELPAKTVKRLESLFFVKDMKDLQKKYQQASKWFSTTTAAITEDEMKKSL